MAVGSWTIGSDPQCDLWIDEASVSRRHCRLLFDGKGYFVEDLASRNGTFVGNERVVTRTALAPGAVVRMSQQVPVPWPFEKLAQQVIRVGRHASNHVVLDHDSVSSYHALLLRDPNGLWMVQDLRSTNGTWIGQPGVRINASRIESGQVIQFGEKPIMLEQLLQQADSAGSGHTSPVPSRGSRLSQDTITKRGPSTFPHVMLDRFKTFPLVPRIITVVSLAGLGLLVLIALVTGGMRLMAEKESSPTEQQAWTESANDRATANVATGEPILEASGTSVVPSSIAAAPASVESLTPEQRSDAIRNQTYWVTVSRQEDRFRIGSALAIDARHLITSGKVIENLQIQDDGSVLEIWHPESGQRFPIQGMKLHPARQPNVERYASGIASIRGMRDQNPAARDEPEFKKLVEAVVIARDLKRVYNVGAIVVATDLKGVVARADLFRPSTERIIPRREMKLSGPVFDADDPLVQPGQPDGYQERNVEPFSLLGKVTEQMGQLWHTQVDRNAVEGFTWEGCPVIDRSGHVSGLFAELPAVQPEIQGTQTASDAIFFDMLSVHVLAEMKKLLGPSDAT
ncbi:MAG: FHA domain-containing protein [Planctomycetota bacterium]